MQCTVYAVTFEGLNFRSSRVFLVSHFYFCGCRVSSRITKAFCMFCGVKRLWMVADPQKQQKLKRIQYLMATHRCITAIGALIGQALISLYQNGDSDLMKLM